MKTLKSLLLAGLLLGGLACLGGIYYVQTNFAGIGLPWTDSVTLPDFPDLPPAQQQLQANQSGAIYFPTRSPYDFSELLTNYDAALQHTGMGQLTLPPGASAEQPVPAMIIVHGSGGIAEERENTYARLFAEHGIASLVIDYYAARGATPETSYLLKTLSASETDILVDAYSALKVLGTHPAIDAARIGITGYSYGGMVTRYALDSRIKDIVAPDVPRFAAHIDVYGPCHQRLGFDGSTGAPYLAIHGDKDNSVDPQECERVRGIIKAAGGPVENLLLAGAGHGWERDLPLGTYDFPYIHDCTFNFDPRTGLPLLNGQPTTTAAIGASRDERAFARADIMRTSPECVKKGYIIGKDEKSDTQAKAKMLEFMERYLQNRPQ